MARRRLESSRRIMLLWLNARIRRIAMTTPARRQYLDIKAQHQDAILLYQIGDFFETFDEDARIAARELQIVLTRRRYGPDELVPLAGVPIHALDTYAARLVARGYKVAICKQMSPPGRGLVQREVTRILTPGTVVDPNMVPATQDNYLVAVAFGPAGSTSRRRGSHGGAGIACIDASTGAFSCTQWPADQLPDALHAELQRLAPAELLVSIASDGESDMSAGGAADWQARYNTTPCPAHYFDPDAARRRLCQHFGVATLDAFGCEHDPLAVAAAGAVLVYLERMNPALLRLLTGLHRYDTAGFVEIDGRTWRALEVIEPAYDARPSSATGRRGATLLDLLDATRTAMGARLLRRTLLQPLKDRALIEQRLDAIAELRERAMLRERIAAALDGLADLERLTARIVHGTALPRELHALAAGLDRVPALASALSDAEASALQALRVALDDCAAARRLIEAAVADPNQDGALTIRPGYNPELDALNASIASARAWIAALEATERQRSGIKSLKVGFNKVFGYYLEVSRPNLSHVPSDYQRRQSLAHAERFVTAELKEHEAVVLHGEEQIESVERQLYADVLSRLSTYQTRLRLTAAALAQADVWLSLATVSRARGFTRPALSDDGQLEIVAGRHPIVEATLDGAEFTANDLRLDSITESDTSARIVLLTGPNMAGKSTYLRQVATIVLLAQIGSFVPAEAAAIGLVDRIFLRVGAEDDLARGLSTFMLEMVETAYILRHATERSLIVLDEVGRGTSTTDGIAIARAVIEHLHDVTGSRTLFATHYRELASLAEVLPRLRTFRMQVAERDGTAIFLHRVVPGASDTSYGVHVARMAGLPASVTDRAASLLLESPAHNSHVADAPVPYRALSDPPSPSELTPNSTANGHGPAREVILALASLNIAAMTPLEALNVLFSLQQRALAGLHGEPR